MEARRGAWVRDVAWLAFCLAASTWWCVTASGRLGATFDEPTYIRLGLESWRTGTSRRLLDLGTMPLPVHVQTLPLYLWERWRGERFNVDGDMDRLLPVARLGTLPFWWLVLVFGWRAGRQMAGSAGGYFAVAFLAAEPNLLAHAALATTDVAVTAFLLAMVCWFQAGREASWWRRVGLPALWLGLAILCKASGLVFGLVGMVALEAGRRAVAMPGPWPKARAAIGGVGGRPFRREATQITLLALAVAFVYCGSDWEPSPSFVRWAHDLPEGPARTSTVWVAEHLRIFSNAGMALARQVRHNVQGHGVYLLSHVAQRAIWYYFPTALTIKATAPLLLLPLLLACLRPRALANWACGLTLVLVIFSLTCRVQTGIRLVLPLLALATAGLGAAVARAARAPGPRARVLAGLGVAAGLWMAWSSVAVWPHGLCFVNELWGGSAGGYRLLSDSNYDWGQGLKELATWQRRHHVPEVTVLYYGSDPALARLPMRKLEWPTVRSFDPSTVPAPLRGRTLAVGTTVLYGSISEWDHLKPWVDYFRQMRPVDRTSTFLIYRFTDQAAPPADAVAARADP
jgi:hypothetical protein